MTEESNSKKKESPRKVASMNSISTSFASVRSQSQMDLRSSSFISPLKLDNYQNRKKSFPKQKLPNSRKYVSPSKKSDKVPMTRTKNDKDNKRHSLDSKIAKKTQIPQKKLLDPDATWHEILSNPANKSIADEPSFNTKYGLEKGVKYPYKIKEYNPHTSPFRRNSKCDKKKDKELSISDSLKPYPKDHSVDSSTLDKTELKQDRNSSTAEEYELKAEIISKIPNRIQSSRDPLKPLSFRNPQNKFSISKKNKDNLKEELSNLSKSIESSK